MVVGSRGGVHDERPTPVGLHLVDDGPDQDGADVG